jgi:hypothetical protein
MGEDSIGQSSAIVNTTVGNSGLSNGLKFAIKNPAGTIIQDITVTSIPVSTAQLMALGSSSTFLMSLFDGSTAGNNEIILAVEINFIEKFGGVLFIPKNHRIVCTLNNNFSVLSALQIGVSGVYV